MISILMPSYNPGPFLAGALDSVLPQLGPDDELVIQDGGSTDGTVELLRSRADPRVKLVSEPDSGQSDALQRALGRAVNPYVGWLNADDIYYPGALDTVRAVLHGDPALDVVYGSATVFVQDGRVVRRSVPGPFTVDAFLDRGCHVFSGAAFFRRDLVREVGGFALDLHYAMDFDLFFRVADRTPRYAQRPETLGGLRWHDASKGGSGTVRFYREARRLRLSWARTPRERWRIEVQMTKRLLALAVLPARYSIMSRLRRGPPPAVRSDRR